LTGERRTLPGEAIADVEHELSGLVEGTDAAARVTFSRGAFETDSEDEIARLLGQFTRSGLFYGAPFWTDAALLLAAGVPTVVYGPCGAGAHATQEWVNLGSLERCAQLYLDATRAICAPRLA
jgi:acetylornithine deacetylase